MLSLLDSLFILVLLPPQAVFGMLLFGESLSLLWWMGASLIVVGLVLMRRSSAGGDDRAATKTQ